MRVATARALLLCLMLCSVARVSRAQRPDSRPTSKQAASNQWDRRCRQFSGPDFAARLAQVSLDDLGQVQTLARQCGTEASHQMRLAALDAYDLIGGELDERIELAVAKATKEKQDAQTKEQQDSFDRVVRFASQTSEENATLVTQYNKLVSRYNELVSDYRSLHDLAEQAVNIGLSMTNQPVYPRLPAVVNTPAAQPLYCTARSFDYGTGMSTTYTTCH